MSSLNKNAFELIKKDPVLSHIWLWDSFILRLISALQWKWSIPQSIVQQHNDIREPMVRVYYTTILFTAV